MLEKIDKDIIDEVIEETLVDIADPDKLVETREEIVEELDNYLDENRSNWMDQLEERMDIYSPFSDEFLKETYLEVLDYSLQSILEEKTLIEQILENDDNLEIENDGIYPETYLLSLYKTIVEEISAEELEDLVFLDVDISLK